MILLTHPSFHVTSEIMTHCVGIPINRYTFFIHYGIAREIGMTSKNTVALVLYIF